MQDLREQIPEILEQCHQRGLVLPYLIVAVAINGSILALRCTQNVEGLDAQVLVSLMTNETMELPINIMVVDAVGDACRVIVTPGGAAFQ